MFLDYYRQVEPRMLHSSRHHVHWTLINEQSVYLSVFSLTSTVRRAVPILLMVMKTPYGHRRGGNTVRRAFSTVGLLPT
jgi:hypothetical protein